MFTFVSNKCWMVRSVLGSESEPAVEVWNECFAKSRAIHHWLRLTYNRLSDVEAETICQSANCLNIQETNSTAEFISKTKFCVLCMFYV